MPERLNREAGRITWHDRESDKPIYEVGTVRCEHCGGQIRRDHMMCAGFCQECNGFYHGDSCEVCVHFEQLLANIEAGRDPNFKPIVSGPRQFGGANFSKIFTGE
jgi:hypothetical protein